MRRALLAVLALALLLAGCGGSGSKVAAHHVAVEPLPTTPATAAPTTPDPAPSPPSASTPASTSSRGSAAKGTSGFAPVATGNAAALQSVANSVAPAAGSGSGSAGGSGSGSGSSSSSGDSGGSGSGSSERSGAGAGSGTGGGSSSAGGTGSGSSSAPPASGQTSPALFVAAADAVCTGFRQEVRTTGSHATTLATQEGELQDLVGETAASLAQLSALTPPPGDATLLARFVALTRSSVRDFVQAQDRSTTIPTEAAQVALEDHDVQLAQDSAHDAAEAQTAAHELGLHVCGSPGAEWL